MRLTSSISLDAGRTLMIKRLKSFLANESGATAVEYALLCAIMTVWILAALVQISSTLSNTFNEVASNLQ
jgi:pilus assembly protein Flp/PilA